MQLRDVLDEKITDLEMNVKNKDQALRHLSQMFYDEGYIDDIEEFVADIYSREGEGITGIGNFIAIPHGQSDAVKRVGIAIGKTVDVIPWETVDGEGIRIIFLFAVSNDVEYARNHLVLLSEVARKLGNDEAIEQLQQLANFEQLLDIFCS